MLPTDWYDLFRKYGFKTVQYSWERIPANHVAKCIFRLDGTTYWIFVAAVCSYDSGWLDALHGHPPKQQKLEGSLLGQFRATS